MRTERASHERRSSAARFSSASILDRTPKSIAAPDRIKSMPLRIALLLLGLATALSAAKKPVTIEAVTESPEGGRRGGGTPIWAPDGKRFLFVQGGRVMLYDIPARSQRELLSLDTLDAAAVAPPEAEVFGWQNRRVSEEPYQWSANGKELLISRKGDLFLYHLDTAKWDQLTATNVAERDPK